MIGRAKRRRMHGYRNLRRTVWSLRDPSTGRVVGRVEHAEFHFVTFRVQQGVRRTVLRTHVRKVHAYVVGELVSYGQRACRRRGVWRRFTYNPYREATFMLVGRTRLTPVYGAVRVRLDRDGAWLQRPRFTPGSR